MESDRSGQPTLSSPTGGRYNRFIRLDKRIQALWRERDLLKGLFELVKPYSGPRAQGGKPDSPADPSAESPIGLTGEEPRPAEPRPKASDASPISMRSGDLDDACPIASSRSCG